MSHVCFAFFWRHVGPQRFCKVLAGLKDFSRKKSQHVSRPTIGYLWAKYKEFWFFIMCHYSLGLSGHSLLRVQKVGPKRLIIESDSSQESTWCYFKIRFCCYRNFLFFMRILTFWNRKYKDYCLYFCSITLYPSFITFSWQTFCDKWLFWPFRKWIKKVVFYVDILSVCIK